MTGVGRGVTMEGPAYHIIFISFAQFIPVYVGLAQTRPNNIKFAHGCTVYVGLAQARPNKASIREIFCFCIGWHLILLIDGTITFQ